MAKHNAGRKASEAASADRHALYQAAVQDTESELDFVEEVYSELNGHKPALIREDFCGTGNTACDWVRRGSGNRAVGIDNDPEVLAWGIEHNWRALSAEQRSRVQLVQGDVQYPGSSGFDAVLAMNFSYYLFRERDRLRAYFRRVRQSLQADGVFFLDAYGGYEAHQELEESRDCDGFTYIWDQHRFNPIDHAMECLIHFEFPDGSRMDRAFEYEWRLWTLPELQEVLDEAGFRRVQVYWEGTDPETEEGNGVYEPTTQGDADAGWIAYLVAQP